MDAKPLYIRFDKVDRIIKFMMELDIWNYLIHITKFITRLILEYIMQPLIGLIILQVKINK